jgi:hypothetical protein
VSAACVSACLPRTPNGCDCFGCCQVARADGSLVNLLLNPSCSLDRIDDQTACPRCVTSTECFNPCGTCELCPGKKSAELPELCAGGSGGQQPAYTCDGGEQVCGDRLPCPAEYYCHQGCCLQAIF